MNGRDHARATSMYGSGRKSRLVQFGLLLIQQRRQRRGSIYFDGLPRARDSDTTTVCSHKRVIDALAINRSDARQGSKFSGRFRTGEEEASSGFDILKQRPA